MTVFCAARRSAILGCASAIGMAVALSPVAADAATLVLEEFGDNPITDGRATVVGDASRLTHSGGELIAAYDTALDTTKVLWPLGRTLTQVDSFRFTVDFSLGTDLTTTGLAQISFGLINSVTTGFDRPGGFGPSGVFPGAGSGPDDAHDVVTVDYFPFDGRDDPNFPFNSITLSPTVITSDDGDDDSSFFDQVKFPQGVESLIDDAGEPEQLPLSTPFTVELVYTAPTRTATLTLEDGSGLVAINAVGSIPPPPGSMDPPTVIAGGADGDQTTIELVLGADDVFAVDAFSVLLWQDTFGFGASTVLGSIHYDRFEVFADDVPEPASAAVLALCGLGTLVWRSRRLVPNE